MLGWKDLQWWEQEKQQARRETAGGTMRQSMIQTPTHGTKMRRTTHLLHNNTQHRPHAWGTHRHNPYQPIVYAAGGDRPNNIATAGTQQQTPHWHQAPPQAHQAQQPTQNPNGVAQTAAGSPHQAGTTGQPAATTHSTATAGGGPST